MATGNKRDVRLAVEIDTVGEESLRRAGDELKRLAKEGGAAAPELAALATQFDKLADQSGALATFRQLGAEVDKLKAAQTEAAAAAGALGSRLTEVKAASEPLRKQQTDLAEGVRQAEVELTRAEAALKTYAAGFDRAGKQTAEFVARNGQLVDTQQKAKVALAEEEAALERVAEALKRVTPEENKLQRQYEAQQARLNDANEALRQRERALKGASEAALAAGASTTDLAASEAELLRATQETVNATRRLADEREQAAAVARELADLDAQNAAALQRQQRALVETIPALEAKANAEQAASLAQEKSAAAARELAEADRLLAIETAGRNEALKRGQLALQAELTTLKEAEAFTRQFAAAKQAAADDALRYVLALEREAEASEKASRRQAELNALAQQNAQRAQRERDITAALEDQAVALAKIAATATAARQAGAALESAFGTVGIRSIAAIESEIEQTNLALGRLQTQALKGGVGLDDLNRAAGAAEVKIARLRAEILQVQAVPGTFERLSTGLNDLVTRFGALSAVIATVGVAARPVLDATIALDQMRRVLTTVTGSSEVAEAQIAKLRITAQQAGVSFTEVGQSYAKFAASALQSGLRLDQVNSAFDAVALAAGNLGLSSDQAKRALEALAQIASKGTVSMEELRQQLGDALPGVLPLLAKELGLTQRELLKVVEAGGLLASDGIPAIDRALRQLGPAGGQVEGLVASFNRFKNVVLEAGTALVDGPLGKAAGVLLTAFAGVVRDVSVVAVSASESISLLGKTIGATSAFLASGGKDFDGYRETISQFAQDASARIEAFKTTAYGAADATAALGKAAGLTGESFAKLTLAQQKSIEAAGLIAQSAEKNVQAAKAQADALTRTVGLLGDEAAAREASATAARLVLKATEDQLTADRALLESFEAQKKATLEQVRLGKQTIENVKTLIEETDKRIEKAAADVEKTQAQADAARAFALAQELVVKSSGDQSKSLDDLRKSVEAAAAAQILASRRYAEGKGSLDDVKKASDALALSKGLLRDAINDLDQALKRQTGTLKADLEIKRAGLELDLAQARNAQRLALERGAETLARQAGIRIQEIEQALRRTGIDGTLKEAQATLEFVAAKEAELRALGQLTPEKQQELELLRKGAVATVLKTQAQVENNRESDAQLDRAKGLLPAIGGVTGATDVNTRSTRENTGAKHANADASDRQTKSAEAAAEAAQRLGREQAGVIRSTPDGDVFANAGRAARNDSFKSTPFVSGSTGGGTYSTGDAVNKPTNGEWTYVISGFDVNGVDARRNRLPGGWKYLGGGTADGAYGLGGFALGNGIGADQKRADIANANAGTVGLTAEQANFVAANNARNAAAASSAPTTTTDTDTPGTRGAYTSVPILGKYEVSLTNERTGITTNTFTDTADQAQAFIDNLQAAFRSANGG